MYLVVSYFVVTLNIDLSSHCHFISLLYAVLYEVIKSVTAPSLQICHIFKLEEVGKFATAVSLSNMRLNDYLVELVLFSNLSAIWDYVRGSIFLCFILVVGFKTC